MKRDVAEVSTQTDPELYPEQFEERHRSERKKRDLPTTPYVTARIDADDMRTMYQTDRAFVVGDEKVSCPFLGSTKEYLNQRSDLWSSVVARPIPPLIIGLPVSFTPKPTAVAQKVVEFVTLLLATIQTISYSRD